MPLTEAVIHSKCYFFRLCCSSWTDKLCNCLSIWTTDRPKIYQLGAMGYADGCHYCGILEQPVSWGNTRTGDRHAFVPQCAWQVESKSSHLLVNLFLLLFLHINMSAKVMNWKCFFKLLYESRQNIYNNKSYHILMKLDNFLRFFFQCQFCCESVF